MIKQLKNRYNDPTMYKRFVVGIDRAKMRLYDCDQGAQDDIIDAGDIEPATNPCLLYTSPSPRDVEESRMPSSA